MEAMQTIACPFYPACDYKAAGDYQIMLHMETLHPEGGDDSPFLVKDDSSLKALAATDDERGGDSEDYIACPQEGCGEALMLTELESHIEMHEQEGVSSEDDSSSRSLKRPKLHSEPRSGETFDTKLSHGLRNLDSTGDTLTKEEAERREHAMYELQFGDSEEDGGRSHERMHKSHRSDCDRDRDASPSRIDIAKAAWRQLLRMPPSERSGVPSGERPKRRLGKSELGPHAHEKQMPSWLVRLLEEGDGAYDTQRKMGRDGKLRKVRWCPNMTSGVVPVIEQLVHQDEDTEYAYLCDPAVRHVSKLRREGGFCGYRNIQMMVSYIVAAKAPGHEKFNEKIPSIFKIQDQIEKAWDLGINASGRIETGGIRGTRKYIGTPDAQAMFTSMGIACDAQGLKPRRGSGVNAYDLLYETVEAYFMDGCRDFNPKVRCTKLPSLYFQHPGHSMTIIGFERKTNGSRNLLVFDPMFHDAKSITKLIGETFYTRDPHSLLTAYRRGTRYLRRYHEFEILKLTALPAPVSSASASIPPMEASPSIAPSRAPPPPPPLSLMPKTSSPFKGSAT